ncbi:MAG: hypothetical protein AB8H79_06805 [Myxococcota bacterium]
MYRWLVLCLVAACNTAPNPATVDDPGSVPLSEPPVASAPASELPVVKDVPDMVIDLNDPDSIPPIPPELDPANHLPVPFTAAELAAGFSLGTTLSYELSGAKTPGMTVGWKVLEHGETDVKIEFSPKMNDGASPPVNTESFTWGALETHASFPKAYAKRSEMSFTVKAGTFDVLHYEVRPPDGKSVERYYFAKKLPGPPVLHSVIVEGVEVHRMEMLTHSKI